MNTPVATIDMEPLSVTPFFVIKQIENIPKSEAAGHLVLETKEMVEVRIAGDKNYAPCFPANAMWRREGLRTITYAERWPEQYRAFKEGDAQEALGTPLEMLKQYGVTPELISLCRALKIYSVEALARLEERGIKALGMNANSLREAAKKFMAERMNGVEAAATIAELQARIAELEAKSTEVPPEQTPPDQVDAMVNEADALFAEMSDAQIKDEIEKLAGTRPKGNPSRATLEQSLRELLEAA